MRFFWMLLLFVLPARQGFAQADSLLQAAAEAPNDSIRLALMANAIRMNLQREPDKTRRLALQYLDIAQKSGLRGVVAKGYNFVGMTWYIEGDNEKAANYYLESYRQAEQEGDSLYAAIVLNNMAAAYEARKKPDEAIRYYEDALARFRRLGDNSWVAKVSHNVAKQQYAKKDYAASLRNYTLAFESFQALGDQHHAGLSLLGIGGYYEANGRYREALQYYEQAAGYLDRKEDPVSYAILLENKALAQISLQQPQEAETNLMEALRIAREHHALEHEVHVISVLVTLYRKKGDFKSALHWQDQYMSLSDSLFNQQKDAALLDAYKQYDLERKEQQISLLNAENDIAELKLQNARRRQTALWIGLAALFSLALGAWYLYRLKQRSNRQLAEKNILISKALEDKELLLREIHHRVKNNLQVISSLLKLQGLHLSDEKALNALNEGRNRVQSMAIIHQNLYQEGQLTAIEAPDYVQKLAETLFRAYNIHPQQVTLEADIEPLLLDVDTAVPIGLILNELISNALKHAFVPGQSGHLAVSLRKNNKQELMLEVADNGRGGLDPQVFDADSPQSSFGIRLVQMLAEKLDADIFVDSTKGARIIVRIKQFTLA